MKDTGKHQNEGSREDPRLRLRHIPYHLFLVFSVLTIGITVSGYLYYNYQKEQVKQDQQYDMTAIAELKVNEIARWRRERLADGEHINQNPMIASYIEEWMNCQTECTDLNRNIYSWLVSLRQNYDYDSVILTDISGHVLISATEDQYVEPSLLNMLPEVVLNGRPAIIDLSLSSDSHNSPFCLLVPLFHVTDRSATPVGILFLWIDPNKFLFPLIHFLGPMPNSTEETFETFDTLLARWQGDDIVVMSEPAYQKTIFLNPRMRAGNARPSGMLRRDDEGIFESIDYRGVPIVGALKAIPDSPWFLVVKVDEAEAYALLQARTYVIIFIIGVLIVSAGVSLGFIWNRQYARFYRKQYESELKRLEFIQRYEYLARYANDIIVLMDFNGRILEANERAVTSYGYTLDELLRLERSDIQVSETYSSTLKMVSGRIDDEEGVIFEAVHRRKNGTTFPVEISSRLIKLGELSLCQNIIRDISERKESEEELRKAHDELEKRVRERTGQLEEANEALQVEVGERKRVEDRLRRHTERLNILSKINRAVLEVRPSSKIAQDALQFLSEVVPCHRASVNILDFGDNEATEVAVLTERGAVVGMGARVSLEPYGAIIQTLSDNGVYVKENIQDVRCDPFPVQALLTDGTRSFVSVPLAFHGELIGTINLCADTPRAYTSEHIEIAVDVADMLAVAIQNARLFSSINAHREQLRALSVRLAEAEEAERWRLNQELHDRVGQSLTALSFNLVLMNKLLPVESRVKVHDQLEDSQTLVEEMSKCIRDVMADLRPPVLDDFGLVAALRWYADLFSRRTGLKTIVQSEEMEKRLPSMVEIALFRIAQEALTNVARHAHAGQVIVALDVVDGKARMCITDDGQGFDPKGFRQPGERQPGWGLISMRERAEAVGGSFFLDSAPGRGTDLMIEIL